MKVIFTEEEVKQIILAHVQGLTGVRMDEVHFSAYMIDFCKVTEKEAKDDHHE